MIMLFKGVKILDYSYFRAILTCFLANTDTIHTNLKPLFK
jgi:hypothetical protein